MHGYVVGFVTLNQILRLFARSVVRVSLEARISDDLFHNDSADPTGLGIPAHVITDFEVFFHYPNA